MTANWTTPAETITSLRFRVGQGTSTELLSDDEVTECLNASRQEINRMKPIYTFSSFPTVANQQRYDVIPTAALGPMKIFWRSCSSSFPSSGIFSDLGDINALWLYQLFQGGAGYIQDITQMRIELVVRNISIIQHYFGGRGWQEKDNMVWLDPRPTTTGTSVYYFAPVARFSANTDVDTQYAEPFMDYAQMVACNIMAAKQSEVASAKIAFGKSVSTAGGMIYYKMARDAERRFYNFMQEPGTVNPT